MPTSQYANQASTKGDANFPGGQVCVFLQNTAKLSEFKKQISLAKKNFVRDSTERGVSSAVRCVAVQKRTLQQAGIRHCFGRAIQRLI